MARQIKLPGRVAGAAVNWQANRIGDPVLRLKFLRKTVGDRCLMSPAAIRETRFWKDNRGKMAMAAMALLAWPAMEVGQGVGGLFSAMPVVSAKTGEAAASPNVWMLETGAGSEVWSNGLRIERRFEVANQPSRFEAYPLRPGAPPVEMTAPVGIVYHTTESHLAPLEESQNKRLRLIGETLLGFVRDSRSYHYVIDRFGRVWRVVRETDEANHAGHSIWADGEYGYLNLNRGFLGVSVETQTATSGEETPATPAQIHSLKVLTEMLRSKYRIAAGNCVTHAQVSVNPSNNQVGYHYDWAAKFPYLDAGLPDNYAAPVPAIWMYGFTYDPSLVTVTGAKYWQGLLKAEARLREDATAHGLRPDAYRRHLSERYRTLFERVKARLEHTDEARQEVKKESTE
jgi:hypothetical protein